MTRIHVFCRAAGRFFLQGRIAAHVALRYARTLPVREYVPFLRRAWLLLRAFRHNRPVATTKGWKLQLYLPPYPSPAFFHALENKLLRTPPAPTSVVFSMTGACGYNCPHCYQKKERHADMPDQALFAVLDGVRDAGVSFFNIEGGEPFLRFDRLSAMLERLDERAEVWVNSNGTGADAGRIAHLKERGLAGVMASIHSPDACIHDAFTGAPGSFETACEFLRLCGSMGVATAVNSVLSEEELADGKLADLMELAKNLGVDFVQLIHPKPCGGWLGKTDGMQTRAEVLRVVEDAHLWYNSPRAAGYPSLAAQVFEEREQGVGCTAGGVDRFYISAGGEVQPCEFLQISFGNAAREPFETVYARMREAFAAPSLDWLCCTQGGAIAALMEEKEITATPVPWEHARELTERWNRGKPTPLYARLGVYAPSVIAKKEKG